MTPAPGGAPVARPAVARDDLPPVAGEILAAMRGAKRALISSSARLDGDGLGSELALAAVCDHLGLACVIVNDGAVPPSLKFLPGIERARTYPDGQEGPFDLLLTVDCGSRAMLERVGTALPEGLPIANIDHHRGSTNFGTWNWVDYDAAAAGQLVYELAALAGAPVHRAMATCLYTAICTDTGGFAYSNTSARTHVIAAHLLEAGVDPSEVTRAIYRSRTPGFIRLMGRVMAGLTLYAEGRLAVARVTRQMMADTGGDPKEAPGLVEIPKSVGTAEVAVLLKETEDGQVKCSLRSEGAVDVNRVANAFGGGGHARASGCRLPGPVEQAEAMLVAAITAAFVAA